MSYIFPSLPTTLGVYTLTRLLGSHETTERYIAKQSHVERSVVLEVLRPGMPQEVLDAFLRNARARAVESLPNVSQVLESMATKGVWYTTLECPDGTPLSRLAEQGKTLTTQQSCEVIKQISRLYELCAERDIAAGPLTADAIFIKGQDDITVLSPVIAGKHHSGLVGIQQNALSEALQEVRPQGVPGETRVKTLLEWLQQDTDDGRRLEWNSIISTAEFIYDQVTPVINKKGLTVSISESSTPQRPILRSKNDLSRLRGVTYLAAGIVVSLTVAGIFIAPYIPGNNAPPVRDGKAFCITKDREHLAIMERPVSIGDYNKFLDAYNAMSYDERNRINKGLPATEVDHTPANWDAQWSAAVSGRKWHNNVLSMESGVDGVSYWDAKAYANYAGGTIPDLHTLRMARRATGEHMSREWTSSHRAADTFYGKAHIIVPDGRSGHIELEKDPAARKAGRSFRLAFPVRKDQKA